MSTDRLKDKVIIVTGSGRSIGRGIAIRLASEGATVVTSSQTPANCGKVADEIKAAGGKAVSIPADVSKESDIQNLVDKTASQFGRLDVMVSNAGIALTKLAMETTAAEWNRIFQVNVLGTFLADTIAARQFIKQNTGGKIINCGSIASHSGFFGLPAYCSTKFAVRALTQSLARELAPKGITVNAYCPGVVDTDMWEEIDRDMTPMLGLSGKGAAKEAFRKQIALGRLQYPEDVAALVAFLASKDADYITGQAIITDGGIVMV
ncbi:MAG: glucose 1-dehydrogenase [Deltaproteobacteria bacterium]|jgi:meso-butanediol dehydrogenase/(S,S)-butanediol dehydrogenase/diacetyl reductase|nr:glucose 1-dehydrogenase [Deltaproteobacteria bacterium]